MSEICEITSDVTELNTTLCLTIHRTSMSDTKVFITWDNHPTEIHLAARMDIRDPSSDIFNYSLKLQRYRCKPSEMVEKVIQFISDRYECSDKHLKLIADKLSQVSLGSVTFHTDADETLVIGEIDYHDAGMLTVYRNVDGVTADKHTFNVLSGLGVYSPIRNRIDGSVNNLALHVFEELQTKLVRFSIAKMFDRLPIDAKREKMSAERRVFYVEDSLNNKGIENTLGWLNDELTIQYRVGKNYYTYNGKEETNHQKKPPVFKVLEPQVLSVCRSLNAK